MFASSSPDLASSASDTLLQYGVLGLVVLILGWFSWGAVQRERRRADAAEERLNSLNEAIRKELVPVMTKSLAATEKLVEVLPDLLAALASRTRR